TGIDYTHEDLAQNIWTNPGETPGNGVDDDVNGYVDDYYGYDFIGADYLNPQPDSDPIDDNDHGTHVAGIVAAVADNATGIAGVAPGVWLMALKAGDAAGMLTTAAIVEAIHYAAANGAKVVNMSFGGPEFDPLEYEAIAAHPDILFVAAAGNGGEDGVGDDNDIAPFSPAGFTKEWIVDGTTYPALPHITAVAALAPSGSLASFSNYGDESVDLAAPGEAIVSTVPQYADAGSAVAVDGGYQTMFWGFGAEDLSTTAEVYDSIVRAIYDFFGITPAETVDKPLLLVDDDQDGTYTIDGYTFTLPDVSPVYRSALDDAGYQYQVREVANGADGPSATEMDAASAVVWFTGWTFYSDPGTWSLPNLTPTDQSNLISYLNADGKLFLSG
nr:hypothetical protein [Anaerolineae bacterium]